MTEQATNRQRTGSDLAPNGQPAGTGLANGDLTRMAADMAAVQKKLAAVSVVKDKKVNTGKYQYAYADLAQILEVCLPILSEQGVAMIQIPDVTAAGVGCQTILAGEGWTLTSVCVFPLGRFAPQDAGSAISYARRYSAQSILGLAPEDDDGQRAQRVAKGEKVRKVEQKTAPPAELVEQMLKSFQGLGIRRSALEAEVGSKLEEMPPAAAKHLRTLYSRIQQGGEEIADVFGDAATEVILGAGEPTEADLAPM